MADYNWLLVAIYCTHLVLSITLIPAAVLPRETIQHPTDIFTPPPSTHHFFTTGDQSRRASQRDAPSSLGTLISTLARQLRSCNNAATRRSKGATRTHLKGTDDWSATTKLFIFFSFFDEYIFCRGKICTECFVSRGLDPRNRWESRNCERLNCVHGLVWPTLCAKGGVCPRLIGRSGGGGSRREAAGGWMCQEPDHWATHSASPQLPNVPGQDDNDRTSSPCLLSW